MRSPYHTASFWVLVAVAGLFSSILGLMLIEGIFVQVWTRSPVADAVFMATTAAAFAVTSRIPNRLWPLTAAAGIGLHCMVYLVSWGATGGGEKLLHNAPIVLAIGSPGLAWCGVASPLLAAYANRLRRKAAGTVQNGVTP